MIKSVLSRSIAQLQALLPRIEQLSTQLERLGQAMLKCWEQRGKVLIAGNGGSAADAMHLAEELSVRFAKNRRALPAIALCDPTVLTCAANDFGFDAVFSRQVEGLGNEGDVLVVFTTSGNSPNIIRAIEAAKQKRMLTAAFLGKDGGRAAGQCDFEFIVQSQWPHRIQEVHQVLYHSLCEWIEARV